LESEIEEKGKELIILVSPICEESLEASMKLRKWARERGYSIREVSALEDEGLSIIIDLNVKRLPALISNGRLISQGKIPEDLDSLLGDLV
jgi:AraC-like DNA-binding protein